MGSRSDWETMRHACETLEALEVPFEQQVVSAHRTPDLLFEYAGSAEERGLQVLIAGAGGAAHLPGMAAAKTALPVLGVPVESKTLKGMDSLLSIVQMPAGVPVGTLAIGRAGAVNAALLAAAIVARSRRPVSASASLATARPQTESVLASPDPTPLRDRRRHRRRPAGADARARRDPARPLVPVPRSRGGRAGRDVGELLVGEYDDPELLDRLAEGAKVVTYEFENVPVESARRTRRDSFGEGARGGTGPARRRSSSSVGSASRRCGSTTRWRPSRRS